MLAPPRKIVLHREGMDGPYVVEVLPPFTEGPSHAATYATYRGARSYAGGLRLCLGLPLHDLCDEANA